MRAVVVCPGRGTYNAAELGYLRSYFPVAPLLAAFDDERLAMGQRSISDLDGAARFSAGVHTRGDNASALIFAASLGDFLAIDRDRVEIVAVTGNSMGWYTALAYAGAVSHLDGFRIANTMGRWMQEHLVGGQLLYPCVDDDWVPRPDKRAALLAIAADVARMPGHAVHLSIDLGGMLVFGGDEVGLAALGSALPVLSRFPMRLANHAAFHTPLVAHVSAIAREWIAADIFCDPVLPLIDGRGAIWWPGSSEAVALHDYTLVDQVTRTYDFAQAIRVAALEFAPDVFIVTGPGNTLGGATAQSLILAGWHGLSSKSEFVLRQAERPLMISMGLPGQRERVLELEERS